MNNSERRYYNSRLGILCNKETKLDELYDFLIENNTRLSLPRFNKWDKLKGCMMIENPRYGKVLCHDFEVSETRDVRKMYLKSLEDGIYETISNEITKKIIGYFNHLLDDAEEIEEDLIKMRGL